MGISAVEKSLSAEGRLKLLRALVGHQESLTMGQLSKITGLHTATVHQHLKMLVEAGLVVRRDIAGEIRFSVNNESGVREKLIQFLEELIYHDILLRLGEIEKLLETKEPAQRQNAQKTLENLIKWYPHQLKKRFGKDIAELAVELGENLERQ
ncbi:MAG: winged helix-turn-helix transcriptional regulator [Candidatus Freyarchaeota archaeon]|nr:winged helix-turn-helix transcriptional regulator [Candidatus Jordarchaeia archaeon]MBS7270046.1 winged helix-turn-helix transcriptional regulator [Candidatus Jordarchaeia archaeon]MBS7280488.1 winged helix-turn-helix transcriptional regulator [Candidatus Jordarchaeia archaeon]